MEGALAPWHVVVLALVVLVVFGSKRLPDAARSLGQSARILRSELRADDDRPGPAPQPGNRLPQDGPPA